MVGSHMPLVGDAVAQHRDPIMSALAIGSELPAVEIDFGFPPEKVNIAERVKGKRVIIVGLPGAFTPT
jgi:hypothetical protein